MVGSAEQSFLARMFEGKLKEDTLYMSITPCFRDEENLDIFTQPHFMKLELFCYTYILHNANNALNKFVTDAGNFFMII